MVMAKKILIVDDEPSITVPLKFLMEQNHFDVMVVHSGEAALTAVDRFDPDLVLLDVMLPTVDGFQVCQQIRETPRHKDLKIIFLSALTRDLDIAKGNTLGADAYITKPFSNADVIKQVSDLLFPDATEQ
jgi:two-component system alkaline phosphatase synthesis response regulator PhoP